MGRVWNWMYLNSMGCSAILVPSMRTLLRNFSMNMLRCHQPGLAWSRKCSRKNHAKTNPMTTKTKSRCPVSPSAYTAATTTIARAAAVKWLWNGWSDWKKI